MKRTLSIVALLLSAMLLLGGCAAANKSESYDYDMAYSSVPAAAPQAVSEESYAAYDGVDVGAGNTAAISQTEPMDADTRKIVYTGYLTLTADDPTAALDTVVQKALSLGGYVAASYTTNDDYGTNYASATIKVPADALAELVTAAKATGKVSSYTLNSDDISLSYYDVQARLTSAEAEETQLLGVLTRCETVEDILAVRAQLAIVRSDIESYQGQINLWDNLTDYATLELNVNRTPRTIVEDEKTLMEIWRASDVWNKITFGFQNTARFMVNALGAIGIFLAYAIMPAIILFCCIGIPLIVRARRKKRKLAEKAAAADTETK